MTARSITVVGAGILGLWQALTLARRGHRVRLIEASAEPFTAAASAHAGAMLAPDCEAEEAPEVVRVLGRRGLELWRETLPSLVNAGSLAVAAARDRPELVHLARLTEGHRTLDGTELAALEPDLAGRFTQALYFPGEAHMATPAALAFLLDQTRQAGAEVILGERWTGGDVSGVVIDCRGMAARDALANLRGVRGERVLLRSTEIRLSRPVRLLHPRQPLYIVPWGDGRYLAGATVIESDDAGPPTARSVLELLGAAYALHPAFGEAEVVKIGAGVRPSFPDNVPRAIVREGGRLILVNGAYRHGFLLAPVLAEAVAVHLASGAAHPLLLAQGG